MMSITTNLCCEECTFISLFNRWVIKPPFYKFVTPLPVWANGKRASALSALKRRPL